MISRYFRDKLHKVRTNRAGTATKAALALCVCILLGGCGSGSDNIKTAYDCLGALDYAGALAALSNAENAGEEAREIARARGIAYLGQADYANAVEQFTVSLHSGTGYPDQMDVDINYYLAAA